MAMETPGAGGLQLNTADADKLVGAVAPTSQGPSGGEVAGSGTMLRQMLRIFMKNKLAVASVAYVISLTLFCFVGPYLYHSNQLDANASLLYTNNPPGAGFPLGADSSGFDILGRIMFAGQASLELGFLSAFIGLTIGVAYGVFAGYRGGVLDTVMMRISVFGRSKLLLILILGFTGWFGTARLLRSEALSLRDREFAQAVRAMGGSSSRIIWRHILPNTVSTMMTVATFAIADSILALTALGYLGVGIPIPQTDWGTMIQQGSVNFQIGYWWQLYPVCIVFLLLVISFNYIGDALRDAFEVRLRER